MSEIKDKSIDLIYSSPPYNLNTRYGEDVAADNLPLDEYIQLLKNVISECGRVIKDDGIIVFEVADSIMVNGKYIQLAGLIQKISIEDNFNVVARHINFVNSNDYIELPEHDWDENYISKGNSHSNIHQILVLSKQKIVFDLDCKIMYENYISGENHPCPTPKNMIDFVLKKYFKKGMNVLDTFMGTAGLGCEVVKKEGNFYGYEINEKVFNIAKDKLENI